MAFIYMYVYMYILWLLLIVFLICFIKIKGPLNKLNNFLVFYVPHIIGEDFLFILVDQLYILFYTFAFSSLCCAFVLIFSAVMHIISFLGMSGGCCGNWMLSSIWFFGRFPVIICTRVTSVASDRRSSSI